MGSSSKAREQLSPQELMAGGHVHGRHARALRARDDAVLLLEGVFLHRPELRAHWD